MLYVRRLLLGFWLLAQALLAQSQPVGQFLTDSLEIGRPFQYSLTYRHPSSADVLFPDTARHFLPFRVRAIAVTTTQTTGEGLDAISRDSAVYTLISFETDSVQRLQVPVQLINATDCTVLFTQADTVFLRSKLNRSLASINGPRNLTMAVATQLVPLQQQLNYPVLGAVLAGAAMALALIYVLFGRSLRRYWWLYQMRQRHVRFLRDYDRLSRRLSANAEADTANQAVIGWKAYLEQLEHQPYASLTTPEITERTGDDRVTDALREADRMIYGGTFSARSSDALRVLREVADLTYHRRRAVVRQSAGKPKPISQSDAAESSTYL